MAAMESAGITVVKGAVRAYHMNGKVERFFRTFKLWARVAVFAFFGGLFAVDRERMATWMQRRLDAFREWYNGRVHQGIQGRTPDSVWSGQPAVAPRPTRAHEVQPSIKVLRRHYRGDLHLPIVDIEFEWPDAA
jgi:transposase InsO family protein